MGRYIQTSSRHGKAREIMETYGAKRVSRDEAVKTVNTHGIIVVVDNGMFEAAGYAYDARELEAFTLPHDKRSKDILQMDRETAERVAQ